jgi:signal transduction histidine kinase
MPGELTGEREVFLSTLPAGRAERRRALAVVLVSAAIFLAVAPFAKVQLAPLPAFIPVYQSALVINDLITAALLFGQFGILRSRALLLLASAYLFSAFMAVAHALSFPGLFAPGGWLSGGAQTTAWLYFLWHAGFPILVIGYALSMNKEQGAAAGDGTTLPTRVAVLSAVALVFLAAGGLALLTTAGHSLLPVLMQGDSDDSRKVLVATTTWLLSLAALPILWRRKPHSVLDLWLMVVLCAWIFDTALASVLNHGRYDAGWYAGRIYGLLASSFVLVVLLLENSVLYARLVEVHESERRKSAELQAVNRELDAFSYSVAHDLRSPLRAVDGYARILESDHAVQLDAEGRRLLGVVRASSQLMSRLIEALLNLARIGRQPLKTEPVELDALVSQLIEELRAGTGGRSIEFTVGKLGTAAADPALLRQALANLLGNAIKFTRDSHPALVEVGCRTETETSGVPVYYVKDNGAGFDMRYAEKLFGVFQRFHKTDEFEGTGVGLSIVQRVINRHGGRIWAESKPGEGATFYFTLQPAA